MPATDPNRSDSQELDFSSAAAPVARDADVGTGAALADRSETRPSQTQSTEHAEPLTPRQRIARFEGVVDQYSRPILNYLARLTGERHQAEDLTQEVFLRLYVEWERIRLETVAAWLYRVARNLATDYFRKKRVKSFGATAAGRVRQHDEHDAGEGAWVADKDPLIAPDAACMRDELAGIVEDAIGALSPKLRDVFILCDLERLSYAEAARVLGVPEKTVSSRLARARAQFGRHVGPHLDSGAR